MQGLSLSKTESFLCFHISQATKIVKPVFYLLWNRLDYLAPPATKMGVFWCWCKRKQSQHRKDSYPNLPCKHTTNQDMLDCFISRITQGIEGLALQLSSSNSWSWSRWRICNEEGPEIFRFASKVQIWWSLWKMPQPDRASLHWCWSEVSCWREKLSIMSQSCKCSNKLQFSWPPWCQPPNFCSVKLVPLYIVSKLSWEWSWSGWEHALQYVGLALVNLPKDVPCQSSVPTAIWYRVTSPKFQVYECLAPRTLLGVQPFPMRLDNYLHWPPFHKKPRLFYQWLLTPILVNPWQP